MTRRSVNLVICLTLIFAASHLAAAPPRNVIILIGDGMGFEQVDAAGMYMYGYDYGLSPAHLLSFQTMPYQGELTTYSASSSITDSAAAGTAIATGFKVNNGVISMAYPSNASYPYGAEIGTLLEHYKAISKSTIRFGMSSVVCAFTWPRINEISSILSLSSPPTHTKFQSRRSCNTCRSIAPSKSTPGPKTKRSFWRCSRPCCALPSAAR